MNGYIRIFRQMTEWEWYDDVNTTRVFIHLLLTVNWRDQRWHGIEIKRGQRVISYRKLAQEVGLSERETRTALEHLQATHEVTQLSTHRCTIVNVENYEKYQCAENVTDTPSDTPSDTVPTTTEEYKNKELKRETPSGGKERKLPLSGSGVPSLDQIKAYCEEIHSVVDPDEFYDYYAARGWKMQRGVKMTDWKAALRSWDARRKGQEPETDKEKHEKAVAKQQERLVELMAIKSELIERSATREELDTVNMNIMVVQEAIERMQEAATS